LIKKTTEKEPREDFLKREGLRGTDRPKCPRGFLGELYKKTQRQKSKENHFTAKKFWGGLKVNHLYGRNTFVRNIRKRPTIKSTFQGGPLHTQSGETTQKESIRQADEKGKRAGKSKVFSHGKGYCTKRNVREGKINSPS